MARGMFTQSQLLVTFISFFNHYLFDESAERIRDRDGIPTEADQGADQGASSRRQFRGFTVMHTQAVHKFNRSHLPYLTLPNPKFVENLNR